MPSQTLALLQLVVTSEATGFNTIFLWTARLGARATLTTKRHWQLVLAAKRWGKLWANQCLIIHSDNQAAVQIINKGTTANPLIMQELQALFWLSAIHNFHITAVYLAGTANTLADAISRLHERQGLLHFYAPLCDLFTPASASAIPLAGHPSIPLLKIHGTLGWLSN